MHIPKIANIVDPVHNSPKYKFLTCRKWPTYINSMIGYGFSSQNTPQPHNYYTTMFNKGLQNSQTANFTKLATRYVKLILSNCVFHEANPLAHHFFANLVGDDYHFKEFATKKYYHILSLQKRWSTNHIKTQDLFRKKGFWKFTNAPSYNWYKIETKTLPNKIWRKHVMRRSWIPCK